MSRQTEKRVEVIEYTCDGCGKVQKIEFVNYRTHPPEGWTEFITHDLWIGFGDGLQECVSAELHACCFECLVTALKKIVKDAVEIIELRRKGMNP